MTMSKERLEEIKTKVSNTEEPMLFVPYEDMNWLIEYAKEQAELTQSFAEKNTELNEFLDDYATVKDWGKNVIDVAMRIIKEQSEQVQELEEELQKDIIEEWGLMKRNKRYRESMEKAIERSNAGKVLGHIDSQVAKILREALEDPQ